jgi:hypothetical protein
LAHGRFKATAAYCGPTARRLSVQLHGGTNVSTTIDQAFIKQFEEEVHQAYQRMGSKLRNTVRMKNGVRGSSTVFQKVGKGSAATKARHGKVPVMNVDHTPVECQLLDFYAGDWVDHLDELKTNIDERQVLANAGASLLAARPTSSSSPRLPTPRPRRVPAPTA